MGADCKSKSGSCMTRFGQAAAAGVRRSRAAIATALLLMSLLSAGGTATADDGVSDEETLLVGVGLVIGLVGTGDSMIDPAFIDDSIVGVLKRAGLEPWRGAIRPGRVAMVMVSAELPEDAADGTPIDVSVTAIGDARSLAGGTLLVAPLRDPEGRVHAIGQGSIVADVATVDLVRLTDAAAGPRHGRLAGGVVIAHQQIGDDFESLPHRIVQNSF